MAQPVGRRAFENMAIYELLQPPLQVISSASTRVPDPECTFPGTITLVRHAQLIRIKITGT